MLQQLGGRVPYRTLWAVCVGINRYQQDNLQPLQFACDDAKAMRDLLVQEYGFPSDHVTLLLNEQATKAHLEEALANLTDTKKVGEGDGVVFFFSGHGQTVPLREGKMGFLIPYDAQVHPGESDSPAPYHRTCLPMSDLLRYAASCPAKHFLILVDACFSGLVLTGKSALPRNVAAYLEKVVSQPVRVVLTAGAEGERAYEDPEWGHGAFTKKLLDLLQPREGVILGDEDANGVVTSAELEAGLPGRVRELTGGQQNLQHGRTGEGEFLLIPGFPAGPWGPGDPGRPRIQLLEPKGARQGAHLEVEGAVVEILGIASDDVGVAEVQCNGQALSLEVLREGELSRDLVEIGKNQAVRFRKEVRLVEGQETELELRTRDGIGNQGVLRFYLRSQGPPAAGTVRVNRVDGAEMVFVPPGEFRMGSDGVTWAQPEQRVDVGGSWVSKFEVTNAQFERFVKASGYVPQGNWRQYFTAGRERYPVVGITWYDAAAYARWAGGRLPTEAEWEKAARGSDGRKWAWGDKAEAQRANLAERLGQAAEIGSFAGDLSPYGCLDLTGNVKEWTASLFAPYSTGEFLRQGEGNGERAVRGGCWRNSLSSAQAASRDRGKPTMGDETRGFRYVLPE